MYRFALCYFFFIIATTIVFKLNAVLVTYFFVTMLTATWVDACSISVTYCVSIVIAGLYFTLLNWALKENQVAGDRHIKLIQILWFNNKTSIIIYFLNKFAYRLKRTLLILGIMNRAGTSCLVFDIIFVFKCFFDCVGRVFCF